MSSDKLYKTNLFKTKRRQIESLTSSGMFHNIIRRTIHRTRRFSPLTLVFIVTLIITIPVLIKTSSLEILDYGLLNSYQDTNTRRDHTFNNLTGCNDISQYLSDPEYRKQNASIVMLTRNNELEDVIKSLDSIETHFNQWFEYPYVFLNDVPFDDEFMDTVRNHTRAQIEFDTLRPEEWEFSMDNDTNRVIDSTLQLQGDRGVLYGNMKSYHQMCRFYSGKFYENELVKQYEWYWRLEPNIDFFCDITYDPFYEMARNGKKYGFTIIIPELYWTIPNLFRITMSYIRERSIKVGTLWNLFTYDYGVVNNDWNATRDDMYHEVDSGTQYLNKFINHESDVHQVIKDRLLIDQFVREGYGDETNGVDNKDGLRKLIQRAMAKPPLKSDKFNDLEYNLCHFWSNFEIAQLSIYNDKRYDEYFKYLDSQGGFWQERWGDAPVHSLGLSLLLDVEDIHYFRDIGYRHDTIQHCPQNHKRFMDNRYESERFLRKGQDSKYDNPYEYGAGCRCKCPPGYKHDRETEDNHAFCINKWFDLTHRDSTERDYIFNLTNLNEQVGKEIERERAYIF